ncbi:MAG: hypothetical protein KC731_06655, partial [Myxococcales bacterium]|nr:hypothetical protein [Myxococcales bacterium]
PPGMGPPGMPAGPPGYGPPPGAPAAKKGGPPVALLVGGGCGLLAVIGVIVLVLAVALGGDDKEDPKPTASGDDTSGIDTSSSGSDDGGDVMVGANYKRIPSTNVEVPVPPGWREDRRSLYTFALSDDGNALLAFTTVSSIGEFNGRLQHATRVFRIESCNMGDAERVRIGPNQLRSRLREGDCIFNGVPAHVATVLVESGRRAHPLVIYAVDKKASKRTEKQAQQTIARMRTR